MASNTVDIQKNNLIQELTTAEGNIASNTVGIQKNNLIQQLTTAVVNMSSKIMSIFRKSEKNCIIFT